MIVDSGTFPWTKYPEKFPGLNHPEPAYHGVVYTEKFGPAGLPDHPHHHLAQKYMQGKPSAILSFGLKGGYDAGVRFYDALQIFKRLVNIGVAKSLACHPASTTHRQMNEQEQAKAGVRPEMTRLSVGIEAIEDLIEDLQQALKV